MTTSSSRPPLSPRLRLSAHAKIVLRRRYLAKNAVRMQAVFQRYRDSGVSKTINLPATATKAEVAAAFLLAYELGCKGLTVFRSGSRDEQIFSCSSSRPC